MGCLDNCIRPLCCMFKYLEPEITFTRIKFSNKTNHWHWLLTLKMTHRTGCRNVSHCQQQSYSGLRSPGRFYLTYLWYDSWVQTFHKTNHGTKSFRIHIPSMQNIWLVEQWSCKNKLLDAKNDFLLLLHVKFIIKLSFGKNIGTDLWHPLLVTFLLVFDHEQSKIKIKAEIARQRTSNRNAAREIAKYEGIRRMYNWCLVPRPHYCARPMRFGSSGPRVRLTSL